MRFLRKKLIARSFSLLGIIILLNSIFYPTISYALTTGPHQPEYTSYEDAGATDMVNLLTGDFTFNMPLLTVPIGEEGGFTVPLSYHAGIGPEQEASWVGLGWNINVGSITRSVNGFPDDAGGQAQTITVQDLTGIRGWSASFLGTNIGWDSQNGHYGVINLGLEIGYKNGSLTSIGLAGVTVGGGNVSFDPARFAMKLVQTALTVATYGGSEVTNIGLQVALDVGIQLGIDAVSPDYTPGIGSQGYWKYTKDTKEYQFHTEYKIWLDQTRNEQMYGIMNLHKPPTTNYTDAQYFAKLKTFVNGNQQQIKQFTLESPNSSANYGAASDINIDLSLDEDYKDNHSPALLAYDNFQVNGQGISGSIKPYRMEVGSVSVGRAMSSSHTRFNLLPFENYKVPFVYEAAIGNRYYHHVGASASVTAPTFYYGLNSTESTTSGGNPNVLNLNLNDITFSVGNRLSSEVNSTKKIAQGHSVDWLTNKEIRNTTGRFTNTAYLDYFVGGTNGPRFNFRKEYSSQNKVYNSLKATNGVITFFAGEGLNFQVNDVVDVRVTDTQSSNCSSGYTVSNYTNLLVTSVSTNQITVNNANISIGYCGLIEVTSRGWKKEDDVIGGFVITSADGMNYHYSIPVYDYGFEAKSSKISDESKNSKIIRSARFANTWLLTAITGPDFVDRGGTDNVGNGVIDENDWGYWVSFNYGKYTDDYMWRTPYNSQNTTNDSKNEYKNYAKGLKEKYYLNSIETRTHVALFIKESRKDAKDASPAKKGSLRLAEIALLTREAYAELIDPTKAYQLKNCSGNLDYIYHTGIEDNNTQEGDNTTGNRLTYIQSNALKRIAFNIDYSLCANAENSDAGYGKLTLKSLSVLGRNNDKIFPDYKFTYSNNKTYSVHKWDGWGMYNSSGTSSGTTHQASLVDSDGWAWALSSIKSPLGNEITVEYERDDYSSISGTVQMPTYTVVAADQNLSDGVTSVSVPQNFTEGERVKVFRNETYDCYEEQTCDDGYGNGYPCTVTTPYSIEHSSLGTIQGSFVYLDDPISITSGQIYQCPDASYSSTSYVETAYVQKLGNHRKGGNNRVKAITLRDDISGVQNKTRYIYTNDTQPWTTSSGVVSVEPDYIRNTEYNFYNWIGYPTTPVLYGKVTVLTGKLSSDDYYLSKMVYEFETPNNAQYSINTNFLVKNDDVVGSPYIRTAFDRYTDYSTLLKYEIEDRTRKIGKLKSIKTYSKSEVLPVATVDYIYTETPLNSNAKNWQGVFTEGNILFERLYENGGVDKKQYYKGQRTTLISHPYVLKKIVSKYEDQTSETENTNWDLVTGAVLETQSTSPLGIRMKSVMEPAYTKYPELGSKVINPTNKNMLTQIAATYTYRIDNLGKELGLTSANVTLWSKEWENYRKLNGGNTYINNNELDDNGNGIIETTELEKKVWRKLESYVWKGDYLRRNADGTHTFSPADKFNFAAPSSNTKWQKLGKHERYSHNSNLIESTDLNGIYASTKFGYNNRLTIASGANVKYEEMAFSSAEDRLTPTSPFFGGEVALGAGTVVTTPVHSGKYALSVTGGYGFVFKSSSASPNNGVLPNKRYRASVWSNTTNGRIYYKINNGAEVCPTPTISQGIALLSGVTWYRVDLDITIPNIANPSIEVGVKSADGSAVVFDDFRFQPAEGVMTGYVYNPSTLNLEYVLDNDNVFTRYQYNDRGILIKTYREMMKHNSEKLVSENKEDFRRFHVDQ